MRDEPIGRSFGFDLLRGLAKGECFGLGEHVCDKHVMMTTQRGERLPEGDEVTGYKPCTLMDQLIKQVLTVGPRFAQ